jgi:hypothetical protein
MKKLILLLLITTLGFAQAPTKNANGFFAGTGTMNASAIGQFDSTSKGFLFPRMTTTQRNAIASPATSLVIFNTTTGAYNYWNGTAWTTFGGGGVPTLQQLLDNNHDLVDGNNFQGTDAGEDNSGTNVNAFGASAASPNSGENVNALGVASAFNNSGSRLNALGESSAAFNSGNSINAFGLNSAFQNTGNDLNAFGQEAAYDNTANDVNAFGFGAAGGNSAPHVNAFGFFAGNEYGVSNVFKNVNLFGFFASADADNQNVFSKWVSGTTKYLGRLSFNNITADRKWELPNASGTIALTSDITSATSLQAVTTNGKTTTKGVTLLVPTSGAPEDSYLNVKLNSGAFIRGVELGHRQTAGDRTGFLKLLNVETFEQLVFDNEKINFQSDTKNINYLFDKTKANGNYTIATTSDIPSAITVDANPTDGSSNAVSSNGVFDALATKVSKSDYTPSHSILVQQSGTGSPTALQVGNNTLVGRVSGGGSDIDDLSTSQVRTMLSINNVDNTSDANKPVSTATQTALDLKADKSSTPSIVIRNITPSTALTGTTSETQITSFNFTIPANTFSANDILKVETIAWEKSGTANASTCRIKLSNTNNYAGASNVLILAASAANINMRGTRTYKIAGGNLKGLMSSSANGIFNDNTLTNVAVSTLALDVTQPIYGFVSLANTSSADSTIVNELIISKW